MMKKKKKKPNPGKKPPITTGDKKSFSALCKELGNRVSATENALLCLAAYKAYMAEKKLDPKSTNAARSFRKDAAREAGLAPSTIDALVQVGKAIAPLPQRTRERLKSSPLGKTTRLLRKLATDKYDDHREKIVNDYLAKCASADPKTARVVLEQKLGIGPKRIGIESKELYNKAHLLAQGEHHEVPFGRGYVVRVELHETTAGRTNVRLMVLQGEKKQLARFLEEQRVPKATPQLQLVSGANAKKSTVSRLPVKVRAAKPVKRAVGE